MIDYQASKGTGREEQGGKLEDYEKRGAQNEKKKRNLTANKADSVEAESLDH